jgi:hypothetical protein
MLPEIGRDGMAEIDGIDPTVAPVGTVCLDCEAVEGWWLHLRRCAQCGHIGCCDDSPAQHARVHFTETGHPVMQSFEPGENWFWNFALDQAAPGPASRVPANWRGLLRSQS